MYERLLDKNETPSFEKLLIYTNEKRQLLMNLHEYMIKEGSCDFTIRFPYGKKYGWSLSYRIKKQLICDIFPEINSFTVMIRLADNQFMKHYENLEDYTKKHIDNRYPCGSGGWIHYRVLREENLNDIKILVKEKLLTFK